MFKICQPCEPRWRLVISHPFLPPCSRFAELFLKRWYQVAHGQIFSNACPAPVFALCFIIQCSSRVCKCPTAIIELKTPKSSGAKHSPRARSSGSTPLVSVTQPSCSLYVLQLVMQSLLHGFCVCLNVLQPNSLILNNNLSTIKHGGLSSPQMDIKSRGVKARDAFINLYPHRNKSSR